MYEVCINSKCSKCTSAEQFPVGTSICSECGNDTEVRDPQQKGGLLAKLGNALGLGNLVTALGGNSIPAAQPQLATASGDIKKLMITLVGVAPKMFDPAEQMSYTFIYDDKGAARVEIAFPVIGDIQNGEVTLGALQPAMTSRPSLDLASWCAFSPNISTDGARIPVAVSRIMATIYLENGQVMLKAATASNRPRPISFDPTGAASAGHSMKANDTIQLNDGDIYFMGDFVFKFSVTDIVG